MDAVSKSSSPRLLASFKELDLYNFGRFGEEGADCEDPFIAFSPSCFNFKSSSQKDVSMSVISFFTILRSGSKELLESRLFLDSAPSEV